MAACLAVLLVVLIGAWPALVSMIRYQTTGVFETSSSDLDAEVEMFAQRLKLKPGMTLCEMGSANGALMSRLAPRVMPGGKLVATSPVRQELAATDDLLAHDACCDVPSMMLWKPNFNPLLVWTTQLPSRFEMNC